MGIEAKDKNEDVKLSPIFRDLLPPHSSMERMLIYEDIKESRKVPALITWKGILVDGYVRYDICKELGIPFECTEMEFESEEEAKFFKIRNQLLQRDMTVFQRCEIVYPFENFIATHVANRKKSIISNLRRGIEVSPTLDEPQDTGDIIAKYAKTTRSTWFMARKLIEKADEITKEYLRQGDITISNAYKKLKSTEASISSTDSFDDIDADLDAGEQAIPVLKSVASNTTQAKHEVRDATKVVEADKRCDFNNVARTDGDDGNDENAEVSNTDDDIGFGRESASAVISTQNHGNHSADNAGTGISETDNTHFSKGAAIDAELEAELAAEEKLSASTGSADSEASDEEDWSTDDVDIDHDPYISEIDINDPDTHLPEAVPHYEMPKRNPIPFPLVRQQVQSSIQTMLFELLVGLCGLRDDDLDRRDEILEIVQHGFKKAKKLIERETTNR